MLLKQFTHRTHNISGSTGAPSLITSTAHKYNPGLYGEQQCACLHKQVHIEFLTKMAHDPTLMCKIENTPVSQNLETRDKMALAYFKACFQSIHFGLPLPEV